MKYRKYLVFILILMLINIGTINAISNDKILNDIKIPTMTVSMDNNIEGGDCNKEAIFGKKSDPNSISHLVNEVLQYPRYIVPALVIVFTTVDLFKAVIAGKEDEMKKAQATAIKRVIAAIAVFLVPLMVNVIMWLADIAWQGLGYACH